VNWNVVLDSLRLLVRHGAAMATYEGLLMATIDYAKGADLILTRSAPGIHGEVGC
jgi:hypothetical protein